MKNAREYKERREEHESASAIYEFEHWNGYSFYPSRYCTTEDIRDMRTERKERGGVELPGSNGRAMILKTENGAILVSYKTEVAEVEDGKFIKLWNGFSNTTLKHINIFRSLYNMPPISKHDWIMQD